VGLLTKCCKPGHEPDDTNGNNDCVTSFTGKCSKYIDKYTYKEFNDNTISSNYGEAWVKQKE
jgi:hypothetical protein